jgi:N-acetylglucosaminyl-diphospho-decaprenol L-rhamnosyltransferase
VPTKLLTVVVNFKTPDMTADAVDAAMKALSILGGVEWSIALVDNDSADGSYAKLREHARQRGWGPEVELLESGHNGGFGFGNNFAIRRAMASERPPDFVYLLNSDAFPAQDAIQRLVAYLDEHPQVGIVGSYIHGVDGEPHPTAFRFPSLMSEFTESLKLGLAKPVLDRFRVQMPLPEQDIVLDWVAGCSMMIRRQVFERIGLFDERFFLYFEETDLCRRAAEAGFQTGYVVTSRVAHVGSASTGSKTWKRYPEFWFDSRRHYFSKQHGHPYFWGATAARLTAGSFWRLRCALRGKPVNEPEHYMRDLLAHSVRASLRREQG